MTIDENKYIRREYNDAIKTANYYADLYENGRDSISRESNKERCIRALGRADALLDIIKKLDLEYLTDMEEIPFC